MPGFADFDPAEPETTMPSFGGNAVLIFLLAIIIGVIGFALMVVTWHRYVLLEGPERDAGLMPSAGIVGSYIGKSILLALLMIPVFFLLGLVAAAFAGVGGLGMVLVVQFIGTFVVGWIVMRLSLVLPAASIGQRMGFGDSWRATTPASTTIIWIVVGLSLINLAASLVGMATVQLAAVSFTVQILLNLLTTLISVSCLTTLYGIYVEGRQLQP